MRLSTKQDIEAPLDFVYKALIDFDQFERMAMRRGAEVERTDRLRSLAPGMGWKLRFPYRGKPRTLLVRLADLQDNTLLLYGLDSPSVEGTARIDVMALSPRRARMTVDTEVRPKTMAARLVLQSLRLAKGRVQHRLDLTGGKLAALIEERWRATQRL